MSNIIIPKNISVEEKLSLMREDAAFDIADGDKAAQGDYNIGAHDNDLVAIGKSISNIDMLPIDYDVST